MCEPILIIPQTKDTTNLGGLHSELALECKTVAYM